MNIAKHLRPDGSLLLVLSGEIDLDSAPALRDLGLGLIESAGCQRMLIDMIDVSFIDSTGINALLTIRNAATDADLPMVLLDPSARVRRLLEITALDTVFEIEQSDHALDEEDLELAD
jgi:anti-sigma B factor antagonist